MSGDVFREGNIDWKLGGKVIDSDFYLLVRRVFVWFLPVPPHGSTAPDC